jgi:hypothetical protein
MALPFQAHGLVDEAPNCFAQAIESVGSEQFQNVIKSAILFWTGHGFFSSLVGFGDSPKEENDPDLSFCQAFMKLQKERYANFYSFNF